MHFFFLMNLLIFQNQWGSNENKFQDKFKNDDFVDRSQKK